MAGHAALDRRIGVRVPAPQPSWERRASPRAGPFARMGWGLALPPPVPPRGRVPAPRSPALLLDRSPGPSSPFRAGGERRVATPDAHDAGGGGAMAARGSAGAAVSGPGTGWRLQEAADAWANGGPGGGWLTRRGSRPILPAVLCSAALRRFQGGAPRGAESIPLEPDPGHAGGGNWERLGSRRPPGGPRACRVPAAGAHAGRMRCDASSSS